MNSLPAKDYEIDVLIGKLAAIYIVARGSFIECRSIVAGKPFVPLDILPLILLIFIPFLYIFSLRIYNIKLARILFGIWFLFFLSLCWYATDKFLINPSEFWKVIFPLAFITACLMIGVDGIVRIKNPDELKIDKISNIPENYHNTHVLIYSIFTITTLVFTFTFIVFIGKYLCDLVIIFLPSLEKNKVLLFYVGMAISFYPSYVLGALIPSVLSVLFERIWNLYIKNHTDET